MDILCNNFMACLPFLNLRVQLYHIIILLTLYTTDRKTDRPALNKWQERIVNSVEERKRLPERG